MKRINFYLKERAWIDYYRLIPSSDLQWEFLLREYPRSLFSTLEVLLSPHETIR